MKMKEIKCVITPRDLYDSRRKDYGILQRKLYVMERENNYYKRKCEYFCTEYKRSLREYEEIMNVKHTVKDIIYNDILSTIQCKINYYESISKNATDVLQDLYNDIERTKNE